MERLGVPGEVFLFLEREKERGKRRKYGGDVVREDREFYDIILGKKEGGRREEKKRGRIG